MNAVLLDQVGRPLRDLRISVTDKCNFRCRYCMPREKFGADYPFLRREEILSFEELVRVARLFGNLGVRKVRLTGGEPLLRTGLPKLIAMLRQLPDIEIALTTNGVLLPKMAKELVDAGLSRVTVSLDTLNEEVFHQMCDADYGVADVLKGIEAAAEAGLSPMKINAVVQRGVNDHTCVDLARYFKGSGHIVRFIEYMDVGTTNGWSLRHVVPAAEIIEAINDEMPLQPIGANYRGEVARRYRYVDGGGEIGLIASITQPFCGDCTRARLTAEGQLVTCLFASSGTDLRTPLRSGAGDEELTEMVRGVWSGRVDRYSELRTARTRGELLRIEMSHLGG